VGLEADLRATVKDIFRSRWTERDGQVVPEPKDIGLGNDAVKLDAAVLYADLAESTNLVDTEIAQFAAEVYKSYLHCAAKVIRSEDGEITAYDGDRVMAVFLGEFKNTRAVRTALKINWAVQEIVNVEMKAIYTNKNYVVRQAVGVDTSKVLVARTGIRGSNDLVWVGRAANYAAKLCGLRTEGYATWITDDVFNVMADETKKSSDGRDMWEARTWTAMNNKRIYRSSWRWEV
jgi:class 3 adenylate cyclase